MINTSNNVVIWILNVERGLSLIIKTPQNYLILYDLGSTSDFSPIEYIIDNKMLDKFAAYSEPEAESKKIAQCIISHPHIDHISDLNNVNKGFVNDNSFYITCQNDKDEGIGENDNSRGHKIDFTRINNPDPKAIQIDNYKALYKDRKLPLSTLVHYDEHFLNNLRIGYYYLTHKQCAELFPQDNQKYSNSLSIVLYLSFGSYSIIIPGDITPEALKQIIDGKCEKRFTDYSKFQGIPTKTKWSKRTSSQPIIKDLIKQGLTVLVAPHHGLESGYPDYLFEAMGNNKPELIILSDKSHDSDNSGSTHANYQNGVASSGIQYNGNKRYSMSTINDGNIKITFNELSWNIYANNDIDEVFK